MPLYASPLIPKMQIECVQDLLCSSDLNDLCDATALAITDGGGFGWIRLPSRDILERFWQGVITMPTRTLFIARLDDVICGACQIIRPSPNNEAFLHAVQLTGHFVAPWARGHGLAKSLIQEVENCAYAEGLSVINLDVRATQTVAIGLYESMNYIRMGTHPFYAYVDGSRIIGYYYYKVLDPASV